MSANSFVLSRELADSENPKSLRKPFARIRPIRGDKKVSRSDTSHYKLFMIFLKSILLMLIYNESFVRLPKIGILD